MPSLERRSIHAVCRAHGSWSWERSPCSRPSRAAWRAPASRPAVRPARLRRLRLRGPPVEGESPRGAGADHRARRAGRRVRSCGGVDRRRRPGRRAERRGRVAPGRDRRAPGHGAAAYAEVTRPGAESEFLSLEETAHVGETQNLAVLEMSKRPGWWRVWVGGQPASAPIRLPGSSGRWQPIATAESWNGGQQVCNRFAFRFERGRGRLARWLVARIRSGKPLPRSGICLAAAATKSRRRPDARRRPDPAVRVRGGVVVGVARCVVDLYCPLARRSRRSPRFSSPRLRRRRRVRRRPFLASDSCRFRTVRPRGACRLMRRCSRSPEYRREDFHPTPVLAVSALSGSDGETWYRIVVPGRPNGGRGWVRGDGVTLGRNPWQVVVHRASRELQLWRGDRLAHRAKVAVGAPRHGDLPASSTSHSASGR